MKRTSRVLVLLLATLMVPSLAHAHVGVSETSGFLHGMGHPLSGLDHICAMVAVGLWAAQMGGRSIWAIPLTFITVMALGGVLGMIGINVPFVETGIVVSVLTLGVLIAASVRLRWPQASRSLVCLQFFTVTRMARKCRKQPRELHTAQDFSLPPHSFTPAESAWASPFKDLRVRKSSASLASQSCFAAVISC